MTTDLFSAEFETQRDQLVVMLDTNLIDVDEAIVQLTDTFTDLKPADALHLLLPEESIEALAEFEAQATA
ncbi:MAG: hypothetical protein GY882_01995 [Actinomycetia bacterium]|nr:hypothetical protein [Actinomycetes bacterium]